MTALRSYQYNLYVFFSVVAFLFVPDFIYSLVNSSYLAGFALRNLAVAGLIAFLLTWSKGKKFGVGMLLLLFLMQATQLAHYQYFGVFYSAFDIALMFKEMRDTFTSFADIFWFLCEAYFVVVLLFYNCPLGVFKKLS